MKLIDLQFPFTVKGEPREALNLNKKNCLLFTLYCLLSCIGVS